MWKEKLNDRDNCFYTGCQTSGVYGDSCQKQCPINCRNNACHIKTGTCFDCEPGWKGATCNTISGIINIAFY